MKQCQVCKAQFASEDAFMIHLGVGAPAFHDCNDATEMRQKGMTQNQSGEWAIDENLIIHRNNWAYLDEKPTMDERAEEAMHLFAAALTQEEQP